MSSQVVSALRVVLSGNLKCRSEIFNNILSSGMETHSRFHQMDSRRFTNAGFLAENI